MSNDDSSEYFIALPDCGLAEQGYFYEFNLSTPDEYPPEMSGKGPRPSPPRISSVPFVRSDDEVYCNLSAGFHVELHDCGLWDASEGISPHATGLVWNPTRLHAEVHNSKDVNALVPVWTNVGTRPLAKAPVAAALSGNMLLGFTLDPVRFSAGDGTPSELLDALEGSRFLQIWGRSCNVPWQVFGGPNACLSGCGHVILCPHCGAYFPTCPWCRRATTRYLFPSSSDDPDLPLMLMDGERGPCVDGARWDGSDIFHLGAARIGITRRFLNVLLEMLATSFHADPIGVLTERMSDEQREWLDRAKGTA